MAYWQMEALIQTVNELGETWTGATGEWLSLGSGTPLRMIATDVLTGIPLGGNHQVWTPADAN